MKRYFLLSLFFFSSIFAEDFEIDLKNPEFIQGVLKTDEGGVITSTDLRIQARHIEYTNRIENGILVKKVVAEGDLLFQHGLRAFVGRRLEYNFTTRSGILFDGRTFTGAWFIGGEQIELKADGTYAIYDGYITTSENKETAWDIHARSVKVTKEHLLSAKNIRFRFIKLPIFWLPSFKMNLKFFSDPPVKYKLRWDKGLGPRATMRYRVFSWEDFNLFFRLDYRLKRGFGGALESEYYSKDNRTIFLTKNYGAHDKAVPDEKGAKRFRLQGLYQWQSVDDRTHIHATYDKLSDDKMPSDFKNDDFEVNTQKRTIFKLDHHTTNVLSQLTLQPRINFFQSLNQQLPLAFTSLRPFTIGDSGIISENHVTAGYLNYVYNRQLKHELPHIKSGRFETHNQLYRPIPLSYLTVTPNVGFVGIYYSNNPLHRPVGQAIFTYGFDTNARILRTFAQHRHLIEPYARFMGLSEPTAGINNHFIFDIDDGYSRLNTLRVGLRNTLLTAQRFSFAPRLQADIYTYAYFGETPFKRTFPKTYLALTWNLPSLLFQGNIAWNSEQQLFDYSNIITQWTVNENLAFAVEFRHRSRYDWRKADHENFILDVVHPISELLHSPLSDGRNTLLARLHARLSPKWSAHLESHSGWGRSGQPRYNAFKIELQSIITTSWLFKVSYEHTPNDDRFMPSLSLVK